MHKHCYDLAALPKKQNIAVSCFKGQEPLAMKELNSTPLYVTPNEITQLNLSARTVDGYKEHDDIGELNFD